MALASAVQDRQSACTEGTLKNLSMGLAFDNFDELTATLSGLDTLHDTMGILYQTDGNGEEPIGLVVEEDVTAERQRARIRRDRSDLAKVMQQIQKTCNPIQATSDTSTALYNLSTGKAASQAVRDCLLEVPKKGKELHEAFIRDCNHDPDRFEKPISKVKLITFRNERELRGIDDSTEYIITGPEQVRLRNFGRALCSRSLKQHLPVFLSQEWQDQSYMQIIGSRHVYLGFRGHCYHFYVSDGQFGGYPSQVRTDRGTENITVAAIQAFVTGNTGSHIYGTSPTNQRTESWWLFFRRNRGQWWIKLFENLEQFGAFHPGNIQETECIGYCFMAVIQRLGHCSATVEHSLD